MNLGLVIGQKGLNSDDWEPIESQMSYGLHFDKDMGWPVCLSADLLLSSGSDDPYEGSTMEISLGARKYFEMGKPKLYAGAGLDYISGKIEVDTVLGTYDESAGAVGFMVEGGVLYPVTEKFNVGLDLRYSGATADFNGTDVAVGGLGYKLVLGMGL